MENFGCFRDRTIEFKTGINQIIGPNESGKSTVIKALFTVIFEDGATRKKTVGSLCSWKAGQFFRLTLKFSVGDKQFTLVRDYGSGSDILTDSDGINYEGKVIGEKLALYFGANDRKLFESIFCFSSDDPAAPESSKARLQSAIETPVFYGFDRGRADQFLEEEIKKLENPRAHGPRELDVLSDQISNRCQEKSELDERIKALSKDEQELEEVRDKLQEHEESLDCLEKELEGATACHEFNLRMANLEERLQVHLSNLSRAEQVADDLKRIDKELNRLKVPGPEEMFAISQKGRDLDVRVEESKQAMDTLINSRKKANRGFAAASLILVLLCLAYVIQQNGYIQSGAVADILPYSIPVMAVVWLSRMAVYLTFFRKKKTATAVFREQVSRLDEFYSQLNKQYKLKAADPIKVLGEMSQRQEALEISAENLRNTIDVLSESKGLDHLNKINEQIEAEVAQLNQEMAPLASFTPAMGKLGELKEGLIATRVRTDALRERSALLTERCAVISTLKESLSRVENEIEILERKHHEISERLEVLKITRLALNQAADQLITDTFEAFGDHASHYLESLTGGRYDELRLSREAGRFKVKVAETGLRNEISEALSSSTRDCIYLAVRLAGIEKLSGDFAPPIILDQAESRMDSSRQGAFFDLMRKVAEKRQVIYIGLRPINAPVDAHLIGFEETKSEALQANWL
jgi:uncharacterized protein YhaN